jgi:hypothetical protein
VCNRWPREATVHCASVREYTLRNRPRTVPRASWNTRHVFDLDYVVGRRVLAISFDDGVTLELWREADGRAVDRATLSAGRVKYESPTVDRLELDQAVDDQSRYAPLLELHRSTVTVARVNERESNLELEFDFGGRITALPMEDVEGWELAGPGTHLVVAVPGDEVAVWD